MNIEIPEKMGSYKRTQTVALNAYLGGAAVDEVPQWMRRLPSSTAAPFI